MQTPVEIASQTMSTLQMSDPYLYTRSLTENFSFLMLPTAGIPNFGLLFIHNFNVSAQAPFENNSGMFTGFFKSVAVPVGLASYSVLTTG